MKSNHDAIGSWITQYSEPTALTPKQYEARAARRGSVDWGPDVAAPRPGRTESDRRTAKPVA